MPSQPDFACVLPDNSTENELRELQERNCQKVKEALHDFQLASEAHWLSSAQAADWTAKASKASAICEQSVQAADWGDLQAAASLAVNAWGSVVMQGAECCTFVSPPFCQDMVRSPATVAMGGLLGLLVLMLAGAACVLPSRPGAGGPESVDPAEEEEPAPPHSGRSARLTGGALGTELEEHWLRGSCLRAMPGASSMARTSSGLFGALHQAFDFQADNVRNQFDHLLSLWRSHCATVADRALGQGQLVDERGLLLQALPELHAELLEGFQRWRRTLQGRKEAGVPDRGISLPLLGGAWWEPLSAMAASDEAASPVELSLQLAEVVTYLLVWGEAGNLRFMPEVIYFITELALAAGYPGHTGLYNVPGSVHVEAASPFRSGLFLAKVIRPIYNVIFSEWYDSVSVDAKTGRDRKRLHRGFEVFLPPDVANYDDWNELFCDPPRLVEALVLTDGKRLFDLAHERRFAALARVDWRASLDGRRTKTHREIHSLWGVFASAHRVVLVHLLLFSAGICVVAGNPAASTGQGQVLLAGREAPERFAALGLLVPLHGLMYAIARWQTLGRAITHRSPVAYYAMSCCRCILALVPLVTYVGVRQLELRGRRAVQGHTDALCALVLHCVVSVLGLLYFLLAPGRRLDRLWSMTPAPVHRRALRYTFWFVVLGVKLLLGMFVFRSVFQEGVGLQIIMLGHLSLADLPRAFQSTVWLSHMLECAVLWFTTFFLFVADTQLWFTIACTVLGVAVACSQRKCRVASQNLCGDGVVKIPERFSKKVLCYSPEVEPPCSSSSHFAVLWDRIMEYMRYEDKCDTHTMRQHSFSGSRDAAPVWAQLSLPLRRPGDGSLEAGGDGGHCSPTGTSACWPAAFAPNAGKACSGPVTWPENAEAQWRLLALARGLSLPMPRPFRVPYIPGMTVLIPHYGESILLLKNELFCGHEEGSHRVPLMDWVQAHYGEELKAFLTRRREVGGESGTAWPEAQASWCEFDEGQWDQICTWASMRMQTLWRTVAGMCLYHPALQCHYELQADRLSCLARRDTWSPSDCFTCLVSMQMYKHFDQVQLQQTDRMLEKFPSLKIAFIDSVERNMNAEADLMHPKQNRRYFSCLIDRNCARLPDGKRVPRYRVELPGYPILGDGKGDNQNHALPFSRGSFVQCIDANQGGYFEQMLLLPCVLGEFRRRPQGWHGPKQILGLPEHITSGVGSIGDFAASAEHAFGTILQRSYTALGARMHYGHPDIMNKEVMMQQGGVSKATKTLNLSEDIFAGMDFALRGGGRAIRHCEYMHFGKGRDLGFNTVLTFFSKLSSGAGEQILTRQMFRLGQLMPLPECLTFFYAHVGYYITQFLVSWSMPLMLFNWLVVLTGDCEASFRAFEYCPGRSAAEVMGGTLSVWFSAMLPFFIVAGCLPSVAELWLERGLAHACTAIARQLLTGSWIYYVFQAKVIAFYVMSELRYGGATYVSTGRGLPTERRPFIGKPVGTGWKLEKVGGLYLDYTVHAYYDGVMLVVSALLVVVLIGVSEVSAQAGSLCWTWASIALVAYSWLYAPFVFNPYQFQALEYAQDFRAWFGFFFEDSGRHWTEWYDRTQLKRRRGLRHSFVDVNFFLVFLGLVAFFSVANKKLRVVTSIYSALPYIKLLYALTLAPPIVGSLVYCSLLLLVGKCLGCSKHMVGSRLAWARRGLSAQASHKRGAQQHSENSAEGPHRQGPSGEVEEEVSDDDEASIATSDSENEESLPESFPAGMGPDDRVAADYAVDSGETPSEENKASTACCLSGLPLAVSAVVVVFVQTVEAAGTLFPLHLLGWKRAVVAGVVLKIMLLQVLLLLAEGLLQSRSCRGLPRPFTAPVSLWVHSNRMARDMITSSFIFLSMAPFVCLNELNNLVFPQFNLHQLLIYRAVGNAKNREKTSSSAPSDEDSSVSTDWEAAWSQCQAGHQCARVPDLPVGRGGSI